jgi:small subunit ribosomal protein S1
MDASRRVRHPGELLNPGDRVEARVLAVDLSRRRISLSLKTAAPADDEAAGAEDLSRYKAPTKGFGTLGDLLKESLKKGR